MKFRQPKQSTPAKVYQHDVHHVKPVTSHIRTNQQLDATFKG
jgi:hypothetical protein